MRRDFSQDVSIKTPLRITYFGADLAEVLAVELFDAAGVKTSEQQFDGFVYPRFLASTLSADVNYATRTVLPAGVPIINTTITVKFFGSEAINIQDNGLRACRMQVRYANDARPDELHWYSPQFGLVKYAENTRMNSAFNGGRVHLQMLNEIAPTPPAVNYIFSNLQLPVPVAPSVCRALTTQTLLYGGPANSAATSDYFGVRRVQAAGNDPFLGTPSMTVTDVLWGSNRANKVSHFGTFIDANGRAGVGEKTIDSVDAASQLLSGSEQRGTAILTNAMSVGVPFAVNVNQVFFDSNRSRIGTGSIAQTVTYLGGIRLNTLAGSFDGCLVRFDFPNGDQSFTTFAAGMSTTQTWQYTKATGDAHYYEVVQVQR